ncbi:hypothetical protein GF359_03410 [candidate division WOR-3 bacterium]|uniref:Sulfatase-modifying factor enzyme domain-containing protein n=1 Tax=candidate division WOR-3 bacterium TaxID=2052148 RepID=A0A9D5QCN7_UNCW3|nr:hypothetical protein [candidate division WOR-3 bacterium]MBD3364242.1 hypothetical protein [candidate division WOR-3 bacterium]
MKKNNRRRGWEKVILCGALLFSLVPSVANAAIVYNLHSIISPDSSIVFELQPKKGPGRTFREDSFPIEIMFYDTLNMPEPGVPCTLTVGRRKFSSVSDSNGVVLFWLPKRLLSKKITCNAYPDHRIEGLYFLYFGIILGSGFETGAGQLEIREEGVRILYPEGFTEKAQDILTVMLDERKVIDSIAGIRLHPLKIMLVDDNAPGICINGYGLSLKQDSSFIAGELFHNFPHEWVEVSLDVNYGIYEDTMNRWIGDGLANYINKEIRQVLLPHDSSWVNKPTAGAWNYDCYEGKVFDLRRWTIAGEDDSGGGGVGWLGYVLAPFFWENIVRKSDNKQLIAQFLAEYGMSDDKSQDTAIAILSRLSVLDIGKELVISGDDYREYVRSQSVYIAPRGVSVIPVTKFDLPFSMGDSSQEATSPVRVVTLGNYMLERHEVSNAQFTEFLNTVGSHEDGDVLWF